MSMQRAYRLGAVTMIPENGIWHYRFKVPGVPRRQRSTKEPLKNQRTAERIALQDHAVAMARARGEEPEVRLQEAFLAWVEAHQGRKSASHLANVERFGRLHLGALADLWLSQVSTKAVEEAWSAFLATHAKSTGNQWLTYIRIVCKWCIRRKMIRSMPFDVKEEKVKRRPRPMLPTRKVVPWLAAVDRLTQKDPAPAMVARLLVGLGLRPSEGRQARWEWVDWDRLTYTPGLTKGGDVVPRPLPPWLVTYLRPRRKKAGLMVATRRGAVVSATTLGDVMERACEAVGIVRLTPHRLRATYATWLSEAGVPIQDIKAILEHKDIETTCIYLGIDLDRVRKGQEKVAQRTGLSGRKTGGKHNAKPRRGAK